MAQNIVFAGIKHCGKSTQGRLLAARLNWQFTDSDELLSAAYAGEYGSTLAAAAPREIMKRHGGEFFRQFEAEVIRSWLRENHCNTVLALGGGVPVNTFLSTAELKALGYWIYLDVAKEIAFDRIMAGGTPPFLAGSDPYGKFLAMFEERSLRYAELADLQIKVPQNIAAEAVHELIAAELIKNKLLNIL